MTSANPLAVIDAYAQALADPAGPSRRASAEGGNAGLQATNGAKYLSINAGGPSRNDLCERVRLAG